MKYRVGLALLVAASSNAFAQSADFDAAAAFGARENIQHISLSPDGKHIGLIAPMPKGQGNVLMTIEIGGDQGQKLALSADGKPARIQQCDWVSNTRLLCQVMAVSKDIEGPVIVTRMIAVNADGSEQKMVSVRQGLNAEHFAYHGGSLIDLLPGDDGAALVSRYYVPESAVGSNIMSRREGLGVDHVDTRTLKSKTVEYPRDNALRYISDGKGNIRVAVYRQTDGRGYDTGKIIFQYRLANDRQWQRLGEYLSATDSGFYPAAVDPVSNVVFGFEKKDGRDMIAKVVLDNSLTKSDVLRRSDVDIDGLILLGRQRKVIGATYATDKRHTVYFDPEIEKLRASLAKALGGDRLVNMVGLSEDEKKMIVWAGSDVDPGQYYYLDRATRQMSPLFPSRAQLDGVKLSEVKPVSIKVADGTLVPGYLTLPPGSNGKGADGKALPAIIMPHGGPSARDEWGFDWLAQFFANRGYAVLQPNYRGSSGYGDNWYRNNGFKSWKVAVGDINDSGRWLVSQGIADPQRLAVFGWSYGGYAALQSAVLDPDLFKAIVAVAPVTDLDALKEEHRYYSDFKMVQQFVGSGPHIAEGSPNRHAANFKAPVLMFHGDMDVNVGVAASRTMADALDKAGKRNELIVYKGLDHYLEDNVVRQEMLAKSDMFLKNTFSGRK